MARTKSAVLTTADRKAVVDDLNAKLKQAKADVKANDFAVKTAANVLKAEQRGAHAQKVSAARAHATAVKHIDATIAAAVKSHSATLKNILKSAANATKTVAALEKQIASLKAATPVTKAVIASPAPAGQATAQA